jgi:hypothetical protein
VTRVYGITCKNKTCDTPIILGRAIVGSAEARAENPALHYVAPFQPLKCNSCGNYYKYGSRDIFEFEVADDALPQDLR